MAKRESRALIPWDERLAEEAVQAAAAEPSQARFFATKAGVLSLGGSPFPNNEAAVIILASMFHNVYYEGPYDPTNPQSPSCYAFADEEKLLKPHPRVVELSNAQSEDCANCPQNKFGSGHRADGSSSKGKACKNTRRLALMSAGLMDENGRFQFAKDPSFYAEGDIAFLSVPPTSTAGYGAFVRQVADNMRRPPLGVVTRLKVVPDAKVQFRITFSPLEKVPDNLFDVLHKRREEVLKTMDAAYSDNGEAEEVGAEKNAPATGGKDEIVQKWGTSPASKPWAGPSANKRSKY